MHLARQGKQSLKQSLNNQSKASLQASFAFDVSPSTVVSLDMQVIGILMNVAIT